MRAFLSLWISAWDGFYALCTDDLFLWLSALALSGVALLVWYLRHRNRS